MAIPEQYRAMCEKIASTQFNIDSDVEFTEADVYYYRSYNRQITFNYGKNVSYYAPNGQFQFSEWNRVENVRCCTGIGSVNIDTSDNSISYSGFEVPNAWASYDYSGNPTFNYITVRSYDVNTNTMSITGGTTQSGVSPLTSFNTFDEAITYVYQYFRNVILTIDGEPWDINYNWISVPSVSGKNGILSLAQIKAESINDGEPVSGASVLAFDSLGNVNIPAIIDEQMPIDPSDPTSVTVGYLIPPLTSGQYSALKILVKQDNIPKDENDADKVVDIEEPTNLLRVGSAVVSGLTPLSHYYFVVKVTDDADVSATSEPKDITLDVAPLDTFFAPDFGTDGKDITRYNASKTIHVHMDIGYVAYDVDYYAAQGALADPSSPSNPAYTISNGEITTADDYQYLCWAYDVSANQRIIPSNCTLWFEFDAFFVNEEGYLDWRMYDDSGLEIIYWCWDTKYAFDANIWYNCKLEATVVNGIITQIKYYVDDDMVSQSVTNIHMLCIDEDNPRPLYFITFQTTELTKLKNMKIYWE